jgi:hypothetical protein
MNNDISTARYLWRTYAIFWVSSIFLAPVSFAWFASMFLSMFIDTNTTGGAVTMIGIIFVSFYSIGSLAKAEVETVRKEMADSPAFAEITKAIVESARRDAEQRSGSVNGDEDEKIEEDTETGSCWQCGCKFEPWVIAASGHNEVKTTVKCKECYFKEQKEWQDKIFKRPNKDK